MAIQFRCSRCQSAFPVGSQLRDNPNSCPICKTSTLSAELVAAPKPRPTVRSRKTCLAPPQEAVDRPAPKPAAAASKPVVKTKTAPKTATPKTSAVGNRWPKVHWRIAASAASAAGLLIAVTLSVVIARGERTPATAETENGDEVAAAVTASEEPTKAAALPKTEPGDAKPEVAETKVAAPSEPEPAAEPEEVAEKKAPEKRAPLAFKHRSQRNDEELRRQLVLAGEIDVLAVTAASRKTVAKAPKNRKYSPGEMPDYAGLPLRMGVECQIGDEAAKSLQALSRKLRNAIAAATPRDGIDTRPSATLLRDTVLAGDWLQPEAVPTLMQMLMAEGRPIRLLLIEALAKIPGSKATAALVQRAMFDLSEDVREAAVEALRDRPAEEVRGPLLKGLRYPWAPAADHAAEALVALKDRGSIAGLVQLLREPNPNAPFYDPERGLAVREMVRINHLANCTMCHATSTASTDPVRGRVPTPGQPLPPAVEYYDRGGGIFVRADVTYLRQDFSVPQPVARPNSWPSSQRYDYMIRIRSLNSLPNEARAARIEQGRSREYEQRDSVLFALRELTGKDAGTATEQWERLIADSLAPAQH